MNTSGEPSSEASVQLIMSGLPSEYAPMLRVSKEYSNNVFCFEKTARYVKNIKIQHALYEQWNTAKLYDWQEKVFLQLVEQVAIFKKPLHLSL